MTLINRILLTGLLLPLGGCVLYGGPPPERPAWQHPEHTTQRQHRNESGFGSDLRLSEFQGAQRPDNSRDWPPSQSSAQSRSEPPFRVSAEPWGASGADSGISPTVYGPQPPAVESAWPGQHQSPTSTRTWPGQSRAAPAVLSGSGASLGPGDVVRVSVFGQPDLETSTVVSKAGRITLPLIGGVDVTGLDSQQAEARIAQAYQGGGYLIDPQITLTVEELRSRQISVLGQVQEPGRFPLSSRMTLLDALALAGGVSNTGGSDVYLIREVAGQTRKFEINIDNMLAAPDTRTLLELGAGDTIYVPEAPLFYIYGEVRRPDGYALKPGMTVMQAISVGGGLTDRGSDSRLRIRRRDGNGGTRTLRPSLEDRVREGDVIYVKERLF